MPTGTVRTTQKVTTPMQRTPTYMAIGALAVSLGCAAKQPVMYPITPFSLPSPDVQESHRGTVAASEPPVRIGNGDYGYGYRAVIRTSQGELLSIPLCSDRWGTQKLHELLEVGASVELDLYYMDRQGEYYKEWRVHARGVTILSHLR